MNSDLPITRDALREALKEHPEWKHSQIGEAEYLVREFPLFPTRHEAWDFLVNVARIQGDLDHDATVSWTYRRITLSLTTHHAGNTITEADIELMKRIDDLYDSYA